MKIDVNEQGTIVLTDVFNSVVFRTAEGNELVVCMRDGGFEIAVLDTSAKQLGIKARFPQKYYNWYTANADGIKRQVCIEDGKSTDKDSCPP